MNISIPSTICQTVGRPADDIRAEFQMVLFIKTPFKDISVNIVGSLPHTRAVGISSW